MSARWLLSAVLSVGAAFAGGPNGAPAAQEEGEAVAEIGQPFRARVTFENERVFTGLLSVDAMGELVLDCDVLGGEVVIDFPAVARIERLTQDDRVEPVTGSATLAGDRDTITMRSGQLAIGSLIGVEDRSVMFASDTFGALSIPRDQVGDLFPGRPEGEAPVAGDGGALGAVSRVAQVAWSDWKPIGPRPRLVADGAAVVLGERHAALTREKDLVGHRIALELEWLGMPEFRIRFGGTLHERAAAPAGTDATYYVSGGTVMQPWALTPTLYQGSVPEIEDDGAGDLAADLAAESAAEGGSGGPALDDFLLAQADQRLDLDAGAIFHFAVKDAETLVFESIEMSDGMRETLNLEFPLGGPVDRLTVEALGRPLTVISVELRDPKQIVAADGLIQIDRPLRGGEVTGFDADSGRFQISDGQVEFSSSAGVAFMPRDRREELNPKNRSVDDGVFRTRSGESLLATQLLFDQGKFALRSDYLSAPTRVPFESLLTLVMPRRQVVRGGANFKMSFDGEAQIEAGFHGITRGADGYQVLRSEPGFKTTVAGPVAGQVWIERSTRSLFHASRRTYPHDVLLGDGQTFPAKIIQIDQENVRLATPFGKGEEHIELPQSMIRALMFDPRKSDLILSELTVQPHKKNEELIVPFFVTGEQAKKDPTKLTEQRLRRALLVPRAQKGNPGTHLLIASNGDLMRGTIIGREGDQLLVESSAGGTVEISIDLLAICVRVENAPEGEADPKERKIKTTRSGGQWTVNLGPRTTLIGDIEEANARVLVLRHPLLGRIEVFGDEFKRLDYGRGFAPKFRKVLDWRTEPMPEPNLGQ